MELELMHDFLDNFKAEIDRREIQVVEWVYFGKLSRAQATYEIQTLHFGEFEPHTLVNSEDLSKILNENAKRGNRPILVNAFNGIHRPMI